MNTLSCPGKTFLCGEYAVLTGGRGLIVTSEPRFVCLPSDADLDPNYLYTPFTSIHPESPAGRWMKTHKVQSYASLWEQLVFADPYFGKGGFGASTAQFLFVYFLSGGKADQKNLHDAFLSVSDQKNPPSGMDLLAQYHGGLSLVSREEQLAKSVSWPFPGLEYFIIPTGLKVPSHEHLNQLATKDFDDLKTLSENVISNFDGTDEAAFIRSIQSWSVGLANHGFLTPESTKLILNLRAFPGVLAAKGCGAMGSDTLMIFVSRAGSDAFIQTLKENIVELGLPPDLKIIGRPQLSEGFKVSKDDQWK